jgi:hypothetical protein
VKADLRVLKCTGATIIILFTELIVFTGRRVRVRINVRVTGTTVTVVLYGPADAPYQHYRCLRRSELRLPVELPTPRRPWPGQGTGKELESELLLVFHSLLVIVP